MQWPPQLLAAPPGAGGCSWSQAKKKGKALSARSQRDTVFVKKSVKRCCQIQQQSGTGKSACVGRQSLDRRSVLRARQYPAEAKSPPAPSSGTVHRDVLQFGKKLADRRCQGAKQQLRSSSRKQEYWAMKSQPCYLTGFQILPWENAASPDVKWAGKVQASRFNKPFFFFFLKLLENFSQILAEEAPWVWQITTERSPAPLSTCVLHFQTSRGEATGLSRLICLGACSSAIFSLQK